MRRTLPCRLEWHWTMNMSDGRHKSDVGQRGNYASLTVLPKQTSLEAKLKFIWQLCFHIKFVERKFAFMYCRKWELKKSQFKKGSFWTNGLPLSQEKKNNHFLYKGWKNVNDKNQISQFRKGSHGKGLSGTITLSSRGKKHRYLITSWIKAEVGPHDTAWWREVMGLVGRRLMAARPSELPWGCHSAMGPSTAANLRKQRRYKTSQEL